MQRSPRWLLPAIGGLILAVLLCWQLMPKRQPAEQPEELTVALYQYVPDQARFEKAIQSQWERSHPEVQLRFVKWDCYLEAPRDDIDVFVFDSVYLGSYINAGMLSPIPQDRIADANDILPYALDACTVNEEVYALPEFLCSDILYTRRGDTELKEVASVADLYAALGDYSFGKSAEPEGKGLLMDMTSSDEKTLKYLQAHIDSQGHYEEEFAPPASASHPDEAGKSLLMLAKMGAAWQESNPVGADEPYGQAALFARGVGRAYIGFTESLSNMGDYANEVDLRLFSMATAKNVPVFYADLAGVNAHVAEDKKDFAFDLVNVITGTDVLVAALASSDSNGVPQYLLVGRKSVYDQLAAEYPLYATLKQLVEMPDAHVMRVMPDGQAYLKENGPAIEEHVSADLDAA